MTLLKRLNIVLLFLAAAAPFKSAVAGTLADFELQTKIETVYSNRLHQLYPDLRFVITVNLRPQQNIDLDLIGNTNLSDPNLDDRIGEVVFASSMDLPREKIAEAIGAPLRKIKLKPVPKAAAEVQKPSVPEKEHGFFENPEHVLQLMQVLIALAFLVLIGIIGFYLKNAFGNFSERLFGFLKQSSGTEEREVRPSSVSASSPISSAFDSSSAKLSDLQLQAMFAECYWANQDAAGSALIRKYPRMEAYLSLRFGREYIEYLKGVPPGPLDFTADPYYLNPNPVFFEMSVSDTPVEALAFCSQFRFNASKADPIQLITSQSQKRLFEIQAKASALRKLQLRLRVRFATVEQEEQVLANAAVPEATKLELPSLYRLSKLSEVDLNQILSHYSLRSLAEAWVGPKWLLRDLEARLPERKRALFLELKAKVAPNRDSGTYQDLIEKALSKPVFNGKEVVGVDDVRLAG